MKVVFSIYDGNNIINGINTWLIRLLPALVANGYEVQVIAILWADEQQCTALPIFKRLAVKCTTIPYPHYTEDIIKWILKYFRKENPDVFVPGNMIPAIYASALISANGTSIVGILHNDDEWYQTLINEFVAPPNIQYFDTLVSVSTALTKKVHQTNKQITLKQIPYGASVSHKSANFKSDELFRVAYIGRIVQEQKQVKDVITQFCECALSIPNTEYHIYGSGPQMNEILKVKQSYGSPSNVIIHGLVINIEEILPSLHAIVLLSDYEGIPVALMEAMGCGVVPICKKIDSGIPELVFNDQTGILIDHPHELKSAIKTLKSNGPYWSELSANSKNYIERNFSSQKNLTDWMDLLESLMLKRKPHVPKSQHIKLPKSNLVFADVDMRKPSVWFRIYRKIRRILVKHV